MGRDFFNGLLEVQNYRVLNTHTQSTLEILSSDAPTSYGITPDFCVIDELTHWTKRDLWDSLISSAAKRATCMVVVITNAGMHDSWQWKTREAIRDDPKWFFSRLVGSVASWIGKDNLEEQSRLLPEIAFRRLWHNEWSSGGGDALSQDDIAAAFVEHLTPMSGREKDWEFVAGLDLGLKRDCSAVVVLAAEKGKAGRIRLARHKLWRPTPGHKVDLIEVERYILDLDDQFALEYVAFDPWQAESMAQRLEADSRHITRQRKRRSWKTWMQEVPPVGANLRKQASLLIESFTDRRLQFYPCEPLRRDLLKLRVEEKSYGYRLTSPRDEFGHGDTVSAFALALPLAHELSGNQAFIVGCGMDSNDALSAFERRQQEYQEEMNYVITEQDKQTYRTAAIYNAFAKRLY